MLRGPQTALYGRGTYAGAINYVTRRPGDKLEGEITATGAEHETYELSGWSGPARSMINGPFSWLPGTANTAVNIRTFATAADIGGEKSNEVTGKLYWMPAESLDISLKLGFSKPTMIILPFTCKPRTENNCCFRTAQAPRAREYFVGEARAVDQVNLYTDLLDIAGGSGTELNRQLAALDIDWTLPNGYTFTSLTGYVEDNVDRGYDTSYAAYDPFPVATPFFDLRGAFNNVDKLEQTNLSQELRLSSFADAPLRWTAGHVFLRRGFRENRREPRLSRRQ